MLRHGAEHARRLVLLVALGAGAAGAVADGLSPALRTMQADDSQNPGMLWVQQGRALWAAEPGPRGRSCQACHGALDDGAMRGASLRHPAWDAAQGRALTLSQRIRSCRSRHQGLSSTGADDDAVLALEAALARASRGRVQSAPEDPRLQPLWVQGRALWQQRMGQLDLACMHCHDQRAGQRLGGTPIPRGDPVGYPVYRLEWQALGSLQRRLRGCMVGVRAEPFAPDAPEWTALELFLKARGAGAVEHAPGVRP